MTVTAPIRLAVIDDHLAISAGVPAALGQLVSLNGDVPAARTVDALVADADSLDVVLLDVRLDDGSSAPENVRLLVGRGWRVVLFTQVRNPLVIGQCLRAGAMAVVGKHEDWPVLAEAVTCVARGEDYLNADWAAAVDALTATQVPSLAPREAEVLRLYAAGLPMKSVARRMGISEETAKEYLTRVKRKYLDAGRPARTKTELYRRAIEDGHLTQDDV